MAPALLPMCRSELPGEPGAKVPSLYIGDMSEIPRDEASREPGAAKLDAEDEAEARRDVEAEVEARRDVEAETEAGLDPEAEGEL